MQPRAPFAHGLRKAVGHFLRNHGINVTEKQKQKTKTQFTMQQAEYQRAKDALSAQQKREEKASKLATTHAKKLAKLDKLEKLAKKERMANQPTPESGFPAEGIKAELQAAANQHVHRLEEYKRAQQALLAQQKREKKEAKFAKIRAEKLAKLHKLEERARKFKLANQPTPDQDFPGLVIKDELKQAVKQRAARLRPSLLQRLKTAYHQFKQKHPTLHQFMMYGAIALAVVGASALIASAIVFSGGFAALGGVPIIAALGGGIGGHVAVATLLTVGFTALSGIAGAIGFLASKVADVIIAKFKRKPVEEVELSDLELSSSSEAKALRRMRKDKKVSAHPSIVPPAPASTSVASPAPARKKKADLPAAGLLSKLTAVQQQSTETPVVAVGADATKTKKKRH